MPTNTPRFGFLKPDLNPNDIWGAGLNTNWDIADGAAQQSELISVSGSLQTQIDNLPTVSGVPTGSGIYSELLLSDAGEHVITHGLNTEFPGFFAHDTNTNTNLLLGVDQLRTNSANSSSVFFDPPAGIGIRVTFFVPISTTGPQGPAGPAGPQGDPGPPGTGADVDAILGTDGNTVISGSSTITIQGFRPEFIATSGSLQNQIDSLDNTFATDTELVTVSGYLQDQIDSVDFTETAILGFDGITVVSGASSVDLTGFRSEFVAASGSLQNQLDNLDDVFATDAELVSVSGHLQTRIDTIVIDELENALVGTDGVTVISGSSFDTIQGFRPEFVAASGSLQNQINSIDVDEPEPAILGFDGITVVSGANSIDLTGFRSEFVSASGSLQSDIDSNSSAINTNTSLIVSTSGSLQSQIDNIDVNEPEDAILGFDGITVVSGANSIDLTGFRPEFISASGSLQSQLDNIDFPEFTETAILGFDGITVVSGANSVDLTGFLSEFVSASGALQSEIDSLDTSLADAIIFNGTPPTVSGQVFTANDTTGTSAIATSARITPAGVINAGFATATHHTLPGNTPNSVSIGGADLSANLTQATSAQATAIGPGCRATATNTTAIGISSISSQAFSVAIGGAAMASGFFSTAIGVGCSATFNGAVAIGNASNATSNNAIAIGSSASAGFGNSIAIGANSTTIANDQLQLGVTNSLVSVSGVLQVQPRTSDPTGVQLRSGSIWIRSDLDELRVRVGAVTKKVDLVDV